tara:strand:+ start:602 stop:1027 length:426 start_codon:yes stop_codon:yes gene_type:complete
MIKTFRGMIASQGQDTIVLHTNDGSIGYRIVKFQTISNDPASTVAEMIVKIYKVSQPVIDEKVDFSDNTLLAVSYGSEGSNNNPPLNIIFDNDVFNQDIYVTYFDDSGNAIPANYYLELEQFKLDLSESTVATLKDIRNKA